MAVGGKDEDKGSGPSGKSGDKVSKEAAKIEDVGGAKTPPGAEPADPREFKAPPGGDDSIQTYGSVAEGAEGEEVIAAMRSFFAAMATADYAAICEGMTEASREQLQPFLKVKNQEGGCETVLEALLIRGVAPGAKRAAEGTVYQVRVEDDPAFVLFTPAGGKASYFVMKREGDEWKSTGLSIGTPLAPIP